MTFPHTSSDQEGALLAKPLKSAVDSVECSFAVIISDYRWIFEEKALT
jgi:hypothetical protein